MLHICNGMLQMIAAFLFFVYNLLWRFNRFSEINSRRTVL